MIDTVYVEGCLEGKLYRTLSKCYPVQSGTRIPDTDSVQNGSEPPAVGVRHMKLLHTALGVSAL